MARGTLALGTLLEAARVGRREGPEAFERGFQVAPQLERIELLIARLQLVARRGGKDVRGAEPLIGRLGAIVDPPDAGAITRLRHQLLHGLEEVHVQAGELIDARELAIGGPGGEAIVADELPTTAPFFCSTWAPSFFL